MDTSPHPVIDSLRDSFDSFQRTHGVPPDHLYLMRESIDKYQYEISELNFKLHGYRWLYDNPIFGGVPIREIGTNVDAKWSGWV